MGSNNARGSDPSWRPSLFVDGCDGIGIHFTWNRPTRRKNTIQKIIFHILNAAGALLSILSDRLPFSPQSTGKRSALGTIREAELYGGVLSSSLSREHLALTAEFLRGDECVLSI